MAVLTKTTASAVFTETDAQDAVAALAAAEGLPAPINVQLTSLRDGVLVCVANRDEVDEWTEMLNASAVRDGNVYGAGWQKRIQFPGLRLSVTVYCAVAPIKWQPHTSVVTA